MKWQVLPITKEKTMSKDKKEPEIKLNIYQRLLAVMADVDYIQKTKGENNLKYTFASHDSVTAKCRESFIKHGIYAEVKIIKDSIEKISIHREKAGYNNAPKTITDTDSFVSYVKLRIKFINIDNPSDFAIGDGVGQGIDDQDKACGKATSYAYKYALLKALAIETGDDPEQDVDYKINKQPDIVEEWQNSQEGKKWIVDNFKLIKDQVEACESLDQLKQVWKEKSVDVARLKRYAPAQYDLLVGSKEYMKDAFDKTKEMDNAGSDNYLEE